jgi:large subunit ribosomal protein L20
MEINRTCLSMRAKRSVVPVIVLIEIGNEKAFVRQLWIARINAACRELGMPDCCFMDAINKFGINLNRRALSEFAIQDPQAFEIIINRAKVLSAQ